VDLVIPVKQPNLYEEGDRWIAHIRVGGRQFWRTFDTQAEALAWLAEMRKLRGGGSRSARWSNPTFAAYANRWLVEDAALRVRPETLLRYRQLVDLHLIPQFGKRRLSEIAPEDIGVWVRDWLNEGPLFQTRQRDARIAQSREAAKARRNTRQVTFGSSPQTVTHGVNVGSAIFRSAIAQRCALANPFAATPRPSIPHSEKPWLTVSDLERLFRQLQPEWLPFYALLAGTGLPYSEAAALRWGDLDWDRKRLSITKRVVRDGSEDAPKTARSRRGVPVPATVIAQLRQHYLRSPFKAKQDHVFCTERGTALSDSNMRQRILAPALKAAGLPNVGHHCFRHSYISNALAAGAPIGYVSRIVGHASIAITMDRYGHIAPDSLDAEGERLDEFMFRSMRELDTDGEPAVSAPLGTLQRERA
jgi:integrase